MTLASSADLSKMESRTAVVDIRTSLDSIASASGSPIQYDLGVIIGSFINTAILVGAILALVFMVIASIQWITAGGDTGKIQKARDKFVQSIIGFAVVASTYAIFLVVQYFFGINVAAVLRGGAGTGGSSAGGGGASQVCKVGQTGSDGGAGNYCTNGGAALMKCFGPGQGPSGSTSFGSSFNHWEPCSCQTGTLRPGISVASC
jgi:hypothetical protein